MQKLRREDTIDKNQSRSKRRDKDDEKENNDPIPLVQSKYYTAVLVLAYKSQLSSTIIKYIVATDI